MIQPAALDIDTPPEHEVTCPVCRRPWAGVTRPRVSLDDNLFIAPAGAAALTRTEAEILFILALRAPGAAGHDSIISAVWGTTEPASAVNIVRVEIASARSKIARLGWTVECVWGRGYRLRPGTARASLPTEPERIEAVEGALRDGYPMARERGPTAHGSAPTAVSVASRRLGMNVHTLRAWLRAAMTRGDWPRRDIDDRGAA